MTDLSPTLPAVAPLQGEIVTVFTYLDLPPDTAAELQSVAHRIRARIGRQVVDIIETGADLLAVKDRLPHGHFGEWLHAEFDMSETTARNYMRAAEAFSGISSTVAVLPPRAVYALASPATPLEFRAQVVESLEAGEALDGAKVIEDVKRAQQAAKEIRAANREAERLAKMPDGDRAKAEKAARSRAARKAKREETARREREEWLARDAREREAAEAVARVIKDALGERRDEVARMLEVADVYKVAKALSAMLS